MSDSQTIPEAVRVRGLDKSYREFLPWKKKTVFRDLNLSIPRRTACGLFGPNGSGKSTLMRILAGAEKPNAGEVRVLGIPPSEILVRKRIGFMPENVPFPPNRTGREILHYLARLRGMERKALRRRCGEMLDRFGFGAEADRRIGRYSFGMGRRLAFLQAVFHQPEVLLLDEPFAGLDPDGIFHIEGAIRERIDAGASVLIATHQFPVSPIFIQAAFLHQGKIKKQGLLEQIFPPGKNASLEIEFPESCPIESITKSIRSQGGTVRIKPAFREFIDEFRDRESR